MAVVDGKERRLHWYQGCAVQLLNFCLLFVVVNLIIGFTFSWLDKNRKKVPLHDPSQDILHVPAHSRLFVAPEFFEEDARHTDEVLGDFERLFALGYPYVPWVGYTSPVFHSTLVNVDLDRDGETRRRTPAPDSPNGSAEVWLLGGSTAFSLYLADDETVAACLQRSLNARAEALGQSRRFTVVNYARPGYYSSQEVVQLQQLLKEKAPPAAVVCLDGYNDTSLMVQFHDVPIHTDEIAAVIDRAQRIHNNLSDYSWVPLVRLAFLLRERLAPPPAAPPPPALEVAHPARVYGANLRTAREVCFGDGVASYFYWQPVSYYRHSLDDTPSVPRSLYDHQDVYQSAYVSVEKNTPGLIALSGLTESYERKRPIFLDMCHYTPAFTRYLAEQMAGHMDVAALLNKDKP